MLCAFAGVGRDETGTGSTSGVYAWDARLNAKGFMLCALCLRLAGHGVKNWASQE